MKQDSMEKRLDKEFNIGDVQLEKGASIWKGDFSEKTASKLKAFIRQEIKRIIGEDKDDGFIFLEKLQEADGNIFKAFNLAVNEIKAEQRRKAGIK